MPYDRPLSVEGGTMRSIQCGGWVKHPFQTRFHDEKMKGELSRESQAFSPPTSALLRPAHCNAYSDEFHCIPLRSIVGLLSAVFASNIFSIFREFPWSYYSVLAFALVMFLYSPSELSHFNLRQMC